MSFVSVAEACRCLGIDAKTLHRWLADAPLPLQRHPHDGRKKGVSSEQLHLLARLHQPSLAPVPQEPPAARPELPAGLVNLLEQVSALHAQIAVVQQQMAELTLLWHQQAPAPVAAAPPAQGSRTSRHPSPPTATRARPAASGKTRPPHKPAHVIARVEYSAEGRYVVICPRRGLLPFEPDTQEWFAWVAQQDSFRFMGQAGHFTAHHEWRVPKGAWRAHRHLRNHTYIVRLAPNHELTLAVLEQAAAALQAHLSE